MAEFLSLLIFCFYASEYGFQVMPYGFWVRVFDLGCRKRRWDRLTFSVKWGVGDQCTNGFQGIIDGFFIDQPYHLVNRKDERNRSTQALKNCLTATLATKIQGSTVVGRQSRSGSVSVSDEQ